MGAALPLQSTEYLTDRDAKVAEHNEYFAFGETWIDERNDLDNDGRQDYLFTGKELDPGTNLYYFGARYYDAQVSQWTSPDPILNEYLRGAPIGGVYRPHNVHLYSYGWNSPVRLRDPNGEAGGEDTAAGCLLGGPVGCGIGFLVDVVTFLGVAGAGAGLGYIAHETLVTPNMPAAPSPVPLAPAAPAEPVAPGAPGKPSERAKPDVPPLAGPTDSNPKGETTVGDKTGTTVKATKKPSEHTKDARPSTKQKHEEGASRKGRDQRGEKGDATRRPPTKRPPNYKDGPWPPKKGR